MDPSGFCVAGCLGPTDRVDSKSVENKRIGDLVQIRPVTGAPAGVLGNKLPPLQSLRKGPIADVTPNAACVATAHGRTPVRLPTLTMTRTRELPVAGQP